MEDTSTFGPVAVEAASLQEAVTLLEEEVIFDELVALGISHGAKGIEGALKLTLKGVTGLDNLLLNRVPLLAGNGWSKRELSEVATNSDAGRLDH